MQPIKVSDYLYRSNPCYSDIIRSRTEWILENINYLGGAISIGVNTIKWISNFNNDPCNQLFEYNDEYGKQRYYRVTTKHENSGECFMFVGCYKPYESIVYPCDEFGNIVRSGDQPSEDDFTVIINGKNEKETHMAAIFDLNHESLYWWDPACHQNDQL